MIPTFTITTCFYNVRQKENHPLKDDRTDQLFLHEDVYFERAKRLFEQPFPLVVFTEPRLEHKVWEYRPQALHAKTRVIAMNWDELPLWNLLSIFTENNQKRPIENVNPNRFTPLYKFLINMKSQFLRITARMNPFHTDCFAWMDMRLYHKYDMPYYELERVFQAVDLNRILIHQMCYTTLQDVENRRDFYKVTRGNIAAGFFAGYAGPILQFAELVAQELRDSAQDECSPTDEQVFGFIVGRNRDLFTPYFGDYGEMLYNLPYVRRNEHLAIWYLEKSFAIGTNYLTFMAADALRKGHHSGCITLSPQVIFDVWYKGYVGAYWINNRQYAKELIYELLEMGRTCRKLKQIIINSLQPLLQMTSYLEDSSLSESLRKYPTEA